MTTEKLLLLVVVAVLWVSATPLAVRGGNAQVRKVRLDELLVERGVVASTSEALALVLAGSVFVKQDERLTSVGRRLAEDTPLRIKTRKDHPWVSRGGLKLAQAVEHWQLHDAIAGCTAVDVGCSTGGFTDVLLAHGARRVFAVDVGYNVLDWRLRTDPRVLVLERTNARALNASHLQTAAGADAVGVGVLVCDASFISLATVLPAAMHLCAPGAIVVALIKPQFEAEQHEVESGGVVRDPAVHERTCAAAVKWLGDIPEWTYLGLEPSPITGPHGNVEFLLYGRKEATPTPTDAAVRARPRPEEPRPSLAVAGHYPDPAPTAGPL